VVRVYQGMPATLAATLVVQVVAATERERQRCLAAAREAAVEALT